MNKRLRIGTFPRTRLRRNRQYPWYRNLISETKLNTEDLILPLFITEGKKIEEHIKTMPSIKRYSIDTVLKKIEEVKEFRIPAIALFPYVEKKLKTFFFGASQFKHIKNQIAITFFKMKILQKKITQKIGLR